MAAAAENTIVGLMGRKVGMTQFYDDKGEAVPCTLLEGMLMGRPIMRQ